jgi:hypothetical protein
VLFRKIWCHFRSINLKHVSVNSNEYHSNDFPIRQHFKGIGMVQFRLYTDRSVSECKYLNFKCDIENWLSTGNACRLDRLLVSNTYCCELCTIPIPYSDLFNKVYLIPTQSLFRLWLTVFFYYRLNDIMCI